ncbi:MAG: hypothetical protein SFY69_13545 [Planctomycetota bacterium]|nr:hypothetical protein [Planctomycetota bacterium]
MGTVLAGIDEAGYGPLLGPLCVGLAVLRAPGHDGPVPDMWKLLKAGVCREPGRGGATDRLGRVPIADSKELKLSNAVTTTHPLVHLERGVLAFLRATGRVIPQTDADLFDALGVCTNSPGCYRVDALPVPGALSRGEADIAAATVERALGGAGCAALSLRADVTWEPGFNGVVRSTGNKGEATIAAIGRLLRTVWETCAECVDADGSPRRLGIVCDRLGGRTSYAGVLAAVVPGCTVTVIEEGPARSRYVVECGTRRAGVSFLTEGERAHLPVALASMVAKYTRELAMRRFNAFWGERARARGVELRPTAGYRQDAHRWLSDVGDLMTGDERAQLVRIA